MAPQSRITIMKKIVDELNSQPGIQSPVTVNMKNGTSYEAIFTSFNVYMSGVAMAQFNDYTNGGYITVNIDNIDSIA